MQCCGVTCRGRRCKNTRTTKTPKGFFCDLHIENGLLFEDYVRDYKESYESEKRHEQQDPSYHQCVCVRADGERCPCEVGLQLCPYGWVCHWHLTHPTLTVDQYLLELAEPSQCKTLEERRCCGVTETGDRCGSIATRLTARGYLCRHHIRARQTFDTPTQSNAKRCIGTTQEGRRCAMTATRLTADGYRCCHHLKDLIPNVSH